MPPLIDRVQIVRPKEGKLQFAHQNVLYFRGSGLKGASLTALEGHHGASSIQVTWQIDSGSPIETEDDFIRVVAQPDTRVLPARGKDSSDSGSVTPTVTNDGLTIQPDVPCSYTT